MFYKPQAALSSSAGLLTTPAGKNLGQLALRCNPDATGPVVSGEDASPVPVRLMFTGTRISGGSCDCYWVLWVLNKISCGAGLPKSRDSLSASGVISRIPNWIPILLRKS